MPTGVLLCWVQDKQLYCVLFMKRREDKEKDPFHVFVNVLFKQRCRLVDFNRRLKQSTFQTSSFLPAPKVISRKRTVSGVSRKDGSLSRGLWGHPVRRPPHRGGLLGQAVCVNRAVPFSQMVPLLDSANLFDISLSRGCCSVIFGNFLSLTLKWA